MTETEQKPSQPEEGIEQSIDLWKNSIVMFAVLLLGALIGYFWFYVKHLPPDPDATDRLGIGDWGAFGDFMGGLMNPIVAFAALYWLTQSVKLQKTELAETREALEGSEKAQKQQAKNSSKNIHISAMTAVVSSLQLQINALNQNIDSIANGLEINNRELSELSGKLYNFNKNNNLLFGTHEHDHLKCQINIVKELQEHKLRAFRVAEIELEKLIKERDAYLEELRNIVDVARSHTVD